MTKAVITSIIDLEATTTKETTTTTTTTTRATKIATKETANLIVAATAANVAGAFWLSLLPMTTITMKMITTKFIK